jgi:hypothetical protein
MQELSNLHDLKVLGKLLIIGNMISFHTNNKKMIFAIILTQWNENMSMVLYLSLVKINAPNTRSQKQHCHRGRNQSLSLWDSYCLACVFMWFKFQIV